MVACCSSEVRGGVRYGFVIAHRRASLPRVPWTCKKRTRCRSAPSPRGEVRREGRLPAHAPLFLRAALQPLRRRPVRHDLSDGCALPARRRRGGLRRCPLHRLQVVHAGVPVRRALHRSHLEHGREMQLLRASPRGRARARVCDRLPGAGDHRRRPRRARATIGGSSTREKVEVRKPEQGTRPKVYYIGADSSSLTPHSRPRRRRTCGPSARPRKSTSCEWRLAQRPEQGSDGALSRRS